MAPDDRETASMYRDVAAHLESDVGDPADIVLAIAVADGYQREHEQLAVTLGGQPIEPRTLNTDHGGRLHLLERVPAGRLVVDYRATVVGEVPARAATDLEWFRYIRPSRYCESDRLAPLARAEFAGLHGLELLSAVSSWVGTKVDYVPGSSRPIDGAVTTLLGRTGVCRDFAHLTTALLRANDVAARVVAVYAPGLEPMDFHAVAEACIDRSWYVVDPTALAPRSSLVRIATGADASDTAFLTTVGGAVDLDVVDVTAVVRPELPRDDPREPVQLR